MLALLLAAAAPVSALQSTRANYQVSYNGRSAGGTMQLRPMGKNWVVTLKLGNTLASIAQSTVFTQTRAGLRPLGSSRHVTTPVSRKAITARYQWNTAKATWGGDAKPSRRGPVVLRSGDVDPLLLNVALASDVAAGRPLRYRILENGRARAASFRNLGKAPLQLGRTSVQATKLFAVSGRKQYVIWIVPGAALPARMLQHEPGGDTIDMRMR